MSPRPLQILTISLSAIMLIGLSIAEAAPLHRNAAQGAARSALARARASRPISLKRVFRPRGARTGFKATRYDDVFRTPLHGQPSGGQLSVNVDTSSRSGYGTVGRFNGISERGATVNVPRGGETTFSMPSNVANYNFGGGVNAPSGVSVQRVDSGGTARFTITDNRGR